MIAAPRLLADLQALVTQLEDDLRERCTHEAAVDAPLKAEYDRARAADRTAQAYEPWRDEQLTQAAVAYVLACVFVRFLEDNDLLPDPRLAGPGRRLDTAKEHRIVYFRENPRDTDLDYLRHVFRDVGRDPTMKPLLGEAHNPLWTVPLSPDGATALLNFFQRRDDATGALVHDFTDPEWNTRFLGDLYQDLSESAQTKYALLQTPLFVEEFILDRTLDPAVAEFGYKNVRLIDPACGSGHFLLGAFDRLFRRWQQDEPRTYPEVLAQRTLDAIFGVDLNPFAAAIARFRLVIAALGASGTKRLGGRGFTVHVASGDSLLHGPRMTGGAATMRQELLLGKDPLAHVYQTEDADELRRILGQQYHAVVGNPPYITVKDPALNAGYRARFKSCSGKYSLAVPFFERFFDLALSDGYVGMITANSFMKREFGKKLIEEFIPRWDLTHVLDTSGAYIPGHGTPTVIVFGRQRARVGTTVRMIMGIQGEPEKPEDPARGLVWSEVVKLLDTPGETGTFVSSSDVERERLSKHPWSIGGGGAAELKEQLDENALRRLDAVAAAIGVMVVPGNDEVFITEDVAIAVRRGHSANCYQPLGTGDTIRDWTAGADAWILFPHDAHGLYRALPSAEHHFWVFRTELRGYLFFGQNREARGLNWRELGAVLKDKLNSPVSIAFGEVATHTHFVLDRGGKVFKQTAPVIKLPATADESEHLGIVGILNSSVGAFWLKQVCQNKGAQGINEGIKSERWEQFYQFNGTKLKVFPLPLQFPVALAHALDTRGTETSRLLADVTAISTATVRYTVLRGEMISLQEELDWRCYRLYNLLPDDSLLRPEDAPIVPIRLGERAFEIVMARKMARGELKTTWFERHGSTPITEIPSHWPDEYRALVERRIAAIESIPEIRLIEQPEYKRRWNTEPWESQVARALRGWLLARMEDRRHWPETQLQSGARLADRLRHDPEFMQVAALYRGRPDFDVTNLVVELAESDSVPFLAAYRYKDTGLRKRAVWERTWELQRQEDAIDARTRLPESDPNRLTEAQAKEVKRREIGDIPVPPKYTSADFRKQTWWSLRGKLDVPKERFILYPGAERETDPTPVFGWAGWDHKEQALALAQYVVDAREREGWDKDRVVPLLAGIQELVSWVKQWHNEVDPTFGVGMGDYVEQFVRDEARALGVTVEEVAGWRPAAGGRGRKRS